MIPALYLVTDRHRTAGRGLVDVVEQALQGGVDAVQLRDKDLRARELIELARRLLERCRRYQALLLINDRVDIAIAVGADGVHLPADSFTPQQARALLGANVLVAVSTHSRDEACRAAAAGASFIVFGPVYPTESKRSYGAPQGLAALAAVTASVRVPVLAIGGVTAERVAEVKRHGAAGVAVIGAILEAADPCAASAALRS